MNSFFPACTLFTLLYSACTADTSLHIIILLDHMNVSIMASGAGHYNLFFLHSITSGRPLTPPGLHPEPAQGASFIHSLAFHLGLFSCADWYFVLHAKRPGWVTSHPGYCTLTSPAATVGPLEITCNEADVPYSSLFQLVSRQVGGGVT